MSQNAWPILAGVTSLLQFVVVTIAHGVGGKVAARCAILGSIMGAVFWAIYGELFNLVSPFVWATWAVIWPVGFFG